MLDPNDPASSQRTGPETETALADAPAQATDGLDATIARLEQNSREVQEFLDSIEQKISRMEPRLERLRQPPTPLTDTPNPAPATEAPALQDADPPTPPIRYAAVASAADDQALQPQPPAPPATQRRRRSDQDDPSPKSHNSRRRLPFPAHSVTDDLLNSRIAAKLSSLLRSPLAWVITASLLLIGVLILAHISDTQPTVAATPASSPSLQANATGASPTAPIGSATSTGISTPKPSANTPATTSSPQPLNTQPYADQPQSSAVPGAILTSSEAAPDTSAASDPTPSPSTPSLSIRSSATKFHVSSGVMAGNLIYSRAPEPPGGLARLFHLQGKVTMEVVISRNGRVQNIKVLSGHRLLRGPARDAVSTWRYRPYLVSGTPVEVATIVSVEFRR